MATRKFSPQDLAEHSRDDSAFIAINGIVWDCTSFAEKHPGGAEVIKGVWGKDASELYNEVHSPGLIKSFLGEGKVVGALHYGEAQEYFPQRPRRLEPEPVHNIVNLFDMEKAARQTLTERAIVYAEDVAADGVTARLNIECFQRILFRPRVLRPVRSVCTEVEILGKKYGLPILNAPVSLSMMAHPDAEIAIAKGLAKFGTTIIIPTMASYSVSEILDSLPEKHPYFFQLYMHPDRSQTEKILAQLSERQPDALIVTVDLPIVSKREGGERYRLRKALAWNSKSDNVKTSSEARAASTWIDADLDWKNIQSLITQTDIPVFIKGIQSAEDAVRAYHTGCAGIYISNHGGRALDGAQPSIMTLLEIKMCYPHVLESMEVFIDGGIRRGSDVLKALCLGAKAVCLGRPFFHSLIYGQEGIHRTMESKNIQTLIRRLR